MDTAGIQSMALVCASYCGRAAPPQTRVEGQHKIDGGDVAREKTAGPFRSTIGCGSADPFFAGGFVGRIVLAGQTEYPQLNVTDQHIRGQTAQQKIELTRG